MSPRARCIAQWRLLQTAPGACASPRDLPGRGWIDAAAPGTIASAFADAGRFDRDAPADLDAFDHWMRADVATQGARALVFHGLAGIADIFLDGALVATSRNMFVPCAIDLPPRPRVVIDVLFRAMGPIIAARGPRARWRPRAVQPATMRFHRQTLIGRMPGWCPPVRALGPYRDVELIAEDAPRDTVQSLTATLCHPDDGHIGLLTLTLGPGEATTIGCAGVTTRLPASAEPRVARLEIPGVAPWWPHTHGEPALHDVTATIDGATHRLGRVGFRAIAVDRGADGRGFGLLVNGAPVFCRGANWISPDILRLGATRADLANGLALAREAGMNLLRVPGSTLYESDDFYALCDETGILVWQDFVFANLDYPADDPAFAEQARLEAQAFLRRTLWSPSIAVLCGGAEVSQQAAMLGLPREAWSNALFDTVLPGVASMLRPDAIWRPNTPSGGALPFQPDEGTTHYYGVSAHLRGFDDIRRSRVRFATECLGFAHVPDRDVGLESDRAAISQPIYGDRIDGDTGAIWHFESVRNHYVETLYGVDVEALRRDDPARYLDLSRAATAEVAGELFGEFRSEGSPTRGALALFFQDVAAPGAGWGVVDHLGEPKPVWHALCRAFAPLALFMTEEGMNGLKLTLVNDAPHPREVDCVFECLREGETAVAAATRRMTLAPRSCVALNASELLGGFFDVAYVFRFGAPSHDVVAARLVDPASGETLSSAAHFPLGRGARRAEIGLSARLEQRGPDWSLLVTARRFAQNVRVVAPGFRARDNWLHLAPRETRRIDLIARDAAAAPRALVTALNALDRLEVTP